MKSNKQCKCNSMKKYSILGIIAAAAVLGSCSNDDTVVNENGMLKGINVTIEAADFAALTRSSYVVDPSRGFVSSWSEGDIIGIYPLGGDQVAFPISEGEGSSTARFDGGSWALRSNVKYSAYYPFAKSNYMVAETAIPVNYIGQAQSGNDNTAGLAAYDYLAAAATQPNSNGTVDLSMKHLGSFVRFQLTMPKAATLVKANVASDGTPFVTTGTVDLSTATPVIMSTTTAASYDIALSNITCEEGEVVKLYTMMAPANFSSSKFTITLTDSESKTYIYECTGGNQLASKSYNYTITETSGGTGATIEDAGWASGHEWVDLGLPSKLKWATCNIGANSPEAYGDYFAWGEVATKQNYTQATYSFYNGDAYNFPTSLLKGNNYDAATATWQGEWRMPTADEFQELVNFCTWTETTKNGVNGYNVQSLSNGNSIFLPKAGVQKPSNGSSTSSGYMVGTLLYYWTATLSKNSKPIAASQGWTNILVDDWTDAYMGYPIRSVCGESNKSTNITPVDLGLSVKWGSMNVGASTYGDRGGMYAWGETETKQTYSWATYKWTTDNGSTFTKYDGEYDLESADDVATVKLGVRWSMPTALQAQELLDNTESVEIKYYGISGLLLKSKVPGYVGKYIFLPNLSTGGFGYWTKSTNMTYGGGKTHSSYIAKPMSLLIHPYSKCSGLPVRPVYN